MESIKNIHDFRMFLELNRDKIYKNAVNASDISSQDEWMKEDQWDEIYKGERDWEIIILEKCGGRNSHSKILMKIKE